MAEEKDIIKASEVAAQWWADNLGTHKQRAGLEDELANILMSLASMYASPNSETREKFYQRLKQILIEELKRTDMVRLSTDYSPCGLLMEASYEFGISDHAFPCKTDMYITENEVRVSEGYGAPEKVIYSKEVIVDDNNDNIV